MADRNHEGHSGWRIDQIDSQVGGWLSTYQPDVVLLLIGTNDIVQDYQLNTAPARLAALLDRIHQLRPATKLIVSSVPPLANASDNTQAAAYNANVRSHVDARAAAGRSNVCRCRSRADGVGSRRWDPSDRGGVREARRCLAAGDQDCAGVAQCRAHRSHLRHSFCVRRACAPRSGGNGLRRDRPRGVLCRGREAGRGRRCAVRMGMAERQRGRSLSNRSCRRCDGRDRDLCSCFDRGRPAARAEGVLPGHQYLLVPRSRSTAAPGSRRAPQTSRRAPASTRTNRCHSSRPQTLPGQR